MLAFRIITLNYKNKRCFTWERAGVFIFPFLSWGWSISFWLFLFKLLKFPYGVCVSASSFPVLMCKQCALLLLRLNLALSSSPLCWSGCQTEQLIAVCQQASVFTMAERKRSAVWSYFTASDKETDACDVCRKAIHYYGNTTNLHKTYKSSTPKKTKEKESHSHIESHRVSICIGNTGPVFTLYRIDRYQEFP